MGELIGVATSEKNGLLAKGVIYQKISVPLAPSLIKIASPIDSGAVFFANGGYGVGFFIYSANSEIDLTYILKMTGNRVKFYRKNTDGSLYMTTERAFNAVSSFHPTGWTEELHTIETISDEFTEIVPN